MEREQDAIYQEGKVVGRVVDPEVDEAGRKVRFKEIYRSDWLLLPDECEFRKYKILIDKVEYASKEGGEAVQKGRILRNLEAEILGYTEQ